MLQKTARAIAALILLTLLAGFSPGVSPARGEELLTVGVPTQPIPESDDFAVTTFGDGWDMSEFTDVSQYLNGAGRNPSLSNIKLDNGLFSARSLFSNLTGQMAYISPLFSGYRNFMQVGGNLGTVNPIDPKKYDCLYVAMQVNSPQYNPSVDKLPDIFLVFWDSYLPGGGQVTGGTWEYLYPETTKYPYDVPVVHNYRLYKMDLKHPPHALYSGSTAWTDYPLWQGLKIHATIKQSIDFQIDWVRLTSCNPDPSQEARITWRSDSSVTHLWARDTATGRKIMLAGVDGGSGAKMLDTSGLAPGAYQIGVGTTSSCCTQMSSQPLVINQTPVIDFTRPSNTTGEDYATSAGNAWDMDPTDVKSIRCTNWSFKDGILNMETAYPAALPGGCLGPALHEADPQIVLNLPGPLNNAYQYRYLSFRFYQNGEYQEPADGMIGRLIWTTPDGCSHVSADIPFDVGWHTYVIDLYDPLNGTPVEAAPSGCQRIPWKDTRQVVSLRFDPNENWTGNLVPTLVFEQKLDWIRLTKEDKVIQGKSFNIRGSVNKPVGDIADISYFYTTDLSNPFQQQAEMYTPNAVSQVSGTPRLFLPALTPGMPVDDGANVTFTWNTAGVSPGKYHICIRASDGYNETVDCSQAPVQVYLP